MAQKVNQTNDLADIRRDENGSYTIGSFQGVPGIDGVLGEESALGKDAGIGCFLGVKGENQDILMKHIMNAMEVLTRGRKEYQPGDPEYITPAKKQTPEYQNAKKQLDLNFNRLLQYMKDYSIPFYSMRYQGHMLWDLMLPATIGYFAGMLQNSNNVTIQASNTTTPLEFQAAVDLWHMVGFDPQKSPWGHLTCDGTVANIEAVWATRELRLLPAGIKYAIEKEDALKPAAQIPIHKPDGSTKEIGKMSSMELLNLTSVEILGIQNSKEDVGIIKKVADAAKLKEEDVWDIIRNKYTPNAMGMAQFTKLCLPDLKHPPAIIVPSTKHYSWQKAAFLLGLGGHAQDEHDESLDSILDKGLIHAYVDANARMDAKEYQDESRLKSILKKCAENGKPVLMVTAVIGSTEESAVDPLWQIIDLRKNFREKYSFDFNIHADAAWGGYLITTIRRPYEIQWPKPAFASSGVQESDLFFPYDKAMHISEDVYKQLIEIRNCDSVTIDPHKWGYIPYPAGSVIYQNEKITNLTTITAPYIDGGSADQKLKTLGTRGIEGSKPGASAAAVFLTHSVIRPHVEGYGKILNCCMNNARILYNRLIKLATTDPELKGRIIMATIPNYRQESKAPDMNIVTYAFNFIKDGKPNMDGEKFNVFNKMIADRLSLKPDQKLGDDVKLIVSSTAFREEEYGKEFMGAFAGQLQLPTGSWPKDEGLACLRSVVMDPWLAEEFEAEGEKFNFFDQVVIPVLKGTILECLKKMDSRN